MLAINFLGMVHMKLILLSIVLLFVTILFFAMLRRTKLDEGANRAVQALADTLRYVLIGIVVLGAITYLATLLGG